MKKRALLIIITMVMILSSISISSNATAQVIESNMPTKYFDAYDLRSEAWDHHQPFVQSTYLENPTPIETLSINLLENGGFEDGVYSSSGGPNGWSIDSWKPSEAKFIWDNTQANSGNKSVKIALTTPNDAFWIQTVPVQPNTNYRLTGWVKTENITHTSESFDAGANLSLYGTWTRSEGLLGTNDWTHVSLGFTTGSETQITVAARLGYWEGTTTGVAWFDDLQLELLNTPVTYIQNPSFESGASEQPDNWFSEKIQGSSASFVWDTSFMHDGSRSAKITIAEQGIARWTQSVVVDQDSEYEIAGWIKTLDVQDPTDQWWTTGAKIGVYGLDSYLGAATLGIRDTHDWTYVSARFITGHTTLVKIACTIGEADPLYARPTSSGTMWCDDLTLTKIRTLDRTYISGQNVALDVYTEDLVSDPTAYIAYLDEVYTTMADLVNGKPYNGDLITVQSDASMYYGLLSGNPILIGPGQTWAYIVQTHGIDFGVPHELGHDFDLWPQSRLYGGQLPFDGAEHWANLKVLYAYDVLGARYPTLTMEMWGETVPLGQVGQRFIDVHAQPWIDDGRKDYQNMHNDVYTGLMYKLRQQVGWEPFKKAFREYNHLSSMTPPPSDEKKVELWANLLSRFAGVDLIPTFQLWGFPVERYTPVQASFTAEPTEGIAPLTVDFNNRSSGDYETCLWDFGDGGTSSDCSAPSHKYDESGVYTINLVASGLGGTDSKIRTNYIIVKEDPNPQVDTVRYLPIIFTHSIQ